MSRLRKFNAKVLGIKTIINGKYTGSEFQTLMDSDDDFSLPMDTDEQEQLIQKFELNNYTTDQITINIMCALYLFCAGIFLMLATRSSRNVSVVLLAGLQSLICTCVSLRYELINDFKIFNILKLRINNSLINTFNCILLILISWVTFNYFDQRVLQFFLHIPLFLYIMAFTIKYWSKEIEGDLGELRQLKYKYKNA